jgi:hypothetical protein
MCKDDLHAHMREDYYEKNHAAIDQEIDNFFAMNEQKNVDFVANTNVERCKWYHPFTYKRCKSREIYLNYKTFNYHCKKHTYEMLYID